MYPVFYVRFIRKGYVWERESEDLRQLKTKAVFAGSSWVSFPQSEVCALQMTEIWRVRTWWRQLIFVSVSQVKPSRKIPAKHSVLLNYHLIHTFCTHTIYSLITHICWGVLLRENLNHKPWELEIFIPTILYTIHYGFSSTPTSQFPYSWEVDSPNTYHILSKCQVRFWYCWKALEEANIWWMQSGVLWDLES